jgi:hypothetical protein
VKEVLLQKDIDRAVIAESHSVVAAFNLAKMVDPELECGGVGGTGN